jgi:hypothetical protein
MRRQIHNILRATRTPSTKTGMAKVAVHCFGCGDYLFDLNNQYAF